MKRTFDTLLLVHRGTTQFRNVRLYDSMRGNSKPAEFGVRILKRAACAAFTHTHTHAHTHTQVHIRKLNLDQQSLLQIALQDMSKIKSVSELSSPVTPLGGASPAASPGTPPPTATDIVLPAINHAAAAAARSASPLGGGVSGTVV